MSYGYEDRLALLAEIRPPSGLPAGVSIELVAAAGWLYPAGSDGQLELLPTLPTPGMVVEGSERLPLTPTSAHRRNAPRAADSRSRTSGSPPSRASLGSAPGSGVFLHVVADGTATSIPRERFGFATLERAQAAGDFHALLDRGRRAGRVQLEDLLRVHP
jgi:hypothetical protein